MTNRMRCGDCEAFVRGVCRLRGGSSVKKQYMRKRGNYCHIPGVVSGMSMEEIERHVHTICRCSGNPVGSCSTYVANCKYCTIEARLTVDAVREAKDA